MLFKLIYHFFHPKLGIAIATSIFGPVIAFGVGGYFSRIYVTLEGNFFSNNIYMKFRNFVKQQMNQENLSILQNKSSVH
jgi:hypothetical protein